MSEVRGSVLGVNGKSVNGKTIYEVAFSDGQTYATFKNDIADTAKRLQGQPAVIQVTEKTVTKNGNVYTNHYLDSIEPGAGATPSGGTPQSIAIKEDYQRKMAPEVEQRVTRLSVIATAFAYAGAAGMDIEEALTLAKKLYKVAYYGETKIAEPPVTVVDEPPRASANGAPDGVNGADVAAQVAEVVGAGTPDW